MSRFKAPTLEVGIRAQPVWRQNPCSSRYSPSGGKIIPRSANKTSRYVWEWTYLRYQRCDGQIAGIDTRQRADRR
ncbi:hypothetical protein HYDPIDRAFT_117833 [Hydnomerulius pinastri MD-312]|uniref:Uncharacterized protein n=1 Tax=Hydnomerulius pinastri MD-312 TaxID=994086 RepID=A0A0C9V3L6_9AGAM|nr:hypothetical protein HYDPIDRAFT_117833 [Hydnomerulius pinastri MD-312]